MPHTLHLLLADDDLDDRFFFQKALKVSHIANRLSAVEDGEKLMDFLGKNQDKLPHALFLDLNMPRKNGSECLLEIKKNKALDHLPVIIYSTSLHEEVADVLYANGADFYIKKTGMVELERVLHYVLTILKEKSFVRPDRDRFVLSSARYNLPEVILK